LGDGRSSDGGAGFPSRATNLVKEGEGTMTLSGNSDSLTGNVIINAGTLAATAGYTASLGRGHDTAPDRSVIVNAGATLSFGAGDIYGGHATQNTPTIDIQGGTVTNTAGHMEFNILNLNNGTLTAGAHVENWGAWNFNGTITSHGTSIMDKTDANATIMLHSGDDMVTPSTTFDVADGSLAISLALTDGRGSDGGADFPVRATGLVKDGEGTMSLTVDPTYTGATEVLAGTLEVVNLTTSPTITVYDGATLTAASIVADTLTIGGTQPALPNAVPEPSTIVLLVLASVCMIFAASRRR
jgi:fibronectin-binding autotransporter adhesin